MRDLKLNRPFLKRTGAHELKLADFVIGKKILLNGRQYTVAGYGDVATERTLGSALEHSAAFVKPSYTQLLGKALTDIFATDNLTILNLRMCQLTPEVVQNFYAEHAKKDWFGSLTSYMTSGPMVAMELVGVNAIATWRGLLGPTRVEVSRKDAPNSLRGRFAKTTEANFGHGSDAPSAGERETGILFRGPQKLQLTRAAEGSATLAVVKPHALRERTAGKIVDAIASKFQIAGALLLTFTQAQAAEFLEVYKYVVSDYEENVKELASGPSLALEVVAPVQAFREFAGNRDPVVAKVVAQDSLRAQFGTDVVHNAVQCTDLDRDAALDLDYIFGILDES